LIELKNVKKKYKKRVLFKDVNLKINGAGLYSFVGENGSGKTTLLNLLSLFIKPSSGKVISKIKGVSFISQKVNLLDDLTIKEHFMMFNVDANVLKKVNLYSKLKAYPNELSFGMKQRIAVLLGLYSSSSLVVCDEPTSHLDYHNSLLIMREIKNVSKSKVVLLVSHNDKFIKKYSDEIYKIENQKVCKIKEDTVNQVIVNKKKNKSKFNIYLKALLKRNKKINFSYFMISFFLLFILCLTVNLKDSFSMYVNSTNSLDYNKFYLKECNDVNVGKVVVKKCSNLKKENIEKLKNSEHILSLNYDVLLNDLYNTNILNVINTDDINLKMGRYPKKYNEVIASDNYVIGEKINLESSKIINDIKTDIYKSREFFTVVGISNSIPFLKENKLYLDHDIVENHLKAQQLINNKVTLYEHFNKTDITDYKYVLYFKNIDLNILEENNIEYISSSYDYYQSLTEAFDVIFRVLNWLDLFLVLTSFFYFFRLAKKKVKSRCDDISFFKASGVNVGKITKIFNKENSLLVLQASVISALLNLLIIRIIFKEAKIDYTILFFLTIFFIWFNNFIYKREIKRRCSL